MRIGPGPLATFHLYSLRRRLQPGGGSVHRLKLALVACASLLLPHAAVAQDRMPPIPAERMTPAQKELVSELSAGRHGAVIGPYIPLLRSPKLLRPLYE